MLNKFGPLPVLVLLVILAVFSAGQPGHAAPASYRPVITPYAAR